jgi:ATP-dependent helicase HrpA
LKKDWEQRNEKICFKKQQLILKQINALEDYPSEILVKGVVLPVSYRFAPGKDEDGVHVSIPAQMLSQFSERDFEWLVPGYLKDKIIATLKNLSKPLRKRLIPISNTADLCLEYIMSIDYQNKDFRLTLKEAILRTKAVNLAEEEINTDELPSHLKMKFTGLNSITNNKVKTKTKYFSSLSQAQKSLSGQKNSNAHQSAKNRKSIGHESVPNNRFTKWPEQTFSIESSFKNGQQQVRLFNAFVDHQSFVSIEQCASLASAKATHIKGLARLILLENRNVIKEFKNTWPDRRELEKLFLRFGGFSQLIDWIVISLIVQNLQDDVSIESKETFVFFSEKTRKILRANIADQLAEAKICLKGNHRVHLALGQLKSEVYAASKADIQEQLKRLWQESSFIQKGRTVFQEFNRYQQAIESRIKRINENFPRESTLMEGWLEWLDWWLEFDLDTLNFDAKTKYWQIFWLLEEYRISLFAVNIKTNGKISSKKLQKEFEALELLVD